MSTRPASLAELQVTQDYFERSSRCLQEADAAFAPAPGMMTAAQHVAHTLDWFRDGAFGAEGFDMNFAEHGKLIAKIETLKEARAWVERAFAAWSEQLRDLSDEDLAAPLPEGPIMGGLPRAAVVGAIVDHSAHHRGALTVYSRLCGRQPAMPYMEATEATA